MWPEGDNLRSALTLLACFLFCALIIAIAV